MPNNCEEKSDDNFRDLLKPRQTRRAFFHDYRDPRIYMFTLRKSQGIPVFSNVAGNPKIVSPPDAPHIELTETGSIIGAEILRTAGMRADYLDIYSYMIMPDHMHLILRVKKRLDQPVTKIIGIIESAITSNCRKSGIILPDQSVFERNSIHDRILTKTGQLDILKKYIADNPRRYLVKKLYPDLFRRHLSITLGEKRFDSVGNIFLLSKPLFPVHVRRRWTQPEKEAYREECLQMALADHVMISPFIHPLEREIMKDALDAGGLIIKITERGFAERWKPEGKWFDLCAAGRYLIIAESGYPDIRRDMNYQIASHMNELAAYIAALPKEGFMAGI